jgi:hypothetical protein
MLKRRGLIVLISLAPGCVPRAAPEPLPPPAPAAAQVLYEEDAQPPARPDLAIVDFGEEVSADGNTATVSGTILNRGDGAARDLQVIVSGVDAQGQIVVRLAARPESDRVAAHSSVRFSVTLERDRSIDQYRVEAVGH